MNRTLIVAGMLCLVAGLCWPWLRNLPFGRLPGDIVIVREGFRLFFPLTTSIVISLVVSFVLWLLSR